MFEEKKGYAWPASALTTTEMAVLADVSSETGKPINVLLKKAVQLAYGGCSSLVGEPRPLPEKSGNGSRNRKQFIVLCGPSHSGKSTFAKKMLGFTVISSSAIRKAVTGSYRRGRQEASVWKKLAKRKRDALRSGKNIILDACHLSERARKHSVEGVDESYWKACIVFDCSFKVIKERYLKAKRMNLARVRDVFNRFKKPSKGELKNLGFDEVREVPG